MEQQEIEKRLSDVMRFLRNQREQITKLNAKMAQLENTLTHCLDDDLSLWLFRNRTERMDPTVPIFDVGRADFHAARYRFAAARVKSLDVADIACGTGYGCRFLMEPGKAKSVIGVDIAEDAIAYATQRHRVPGIEYRCAPANALPFEANSLDTIVSFETIERVDDDLAVISEFARVLRENGKLICSTPNDWPLEIAPFHKKIYNRDSFRDLLSTKFNVLEMFNQNSGTDFDYNRAQKAGIVPTTDKNQFLAECFIAVCEVRK